MLDDKTDTALLVKTNSELIEEVGQDLFASAAERALAERLQAAIEELDRLTQALQRMEAASGQNA